ncbi:hypothetical protein IID24_00265 [Patescibacteria group bacterium]|nr:hypothetical protein [Patescibacteria group bacterium]
MDEHEVEDTVEIHKVMGTVSQWRELLLPLLKDETLQEARDNLLELRELLGIGYDSLPAPDKVLRHLDRAIELTPGTGKPSTVPYPDSS